MIDDDEYYGENFQESILKRYPMVELLLAINGGHAHNDIGKQARERDDF